MMIMNLCPECRKALSDFYELWPDDESPEQMRGCQQCVVKKEYYGRAYEVRSKRRYRTSKTQHTQYVSHRPRAGESKAARWREQFDND